MKRIECGLPNRDGNDDETCSGILAHQVSSRMIEFKRGDQTGILVGENWQISLTCPKCGRKHGIVCEKGEIQERDLNYRDESKKDDDPSDTDPAPATAVEDDTDPKDEPADPPKPKASATK